MNQIRLLLYPTSACAATGCVTVACVGEIPDQGSRENAWACCRHHTTYAPRKDEPSRSSEHPAVSSLVQDWENRDPCTFFQRTYQEPPPKEGTRYDKVCTTVVHPAQFFIVLNERELNYKGVVITLVLFPLATDAWKLDNKGSCFISTSSRYTFINGEQCGYNITEIAMTLCLKFWLERKIFCSSAKYFSSVSFYMQLLWVRSKPESRSVDGPVCVMIITGWPHWDQGLRVLDAGKNVIKAILCPKEREV